MKKILIVDDEPLTCQLIAKVLKLQGYTSAIATDSRAIMDAIKTEEPILILLDYHLGHSHGLEVLQDLRRDVISRTIPVVITSGIDRRQEALDAGAQAFLLKPFDWHDLAEVITQVINNHSEN